METGIDDSNRFKCPCQEIHKEKPLKSGCVDKETHYFSGEVQLYIHFYEKRSAFVTAYVAALATIGALALEFPNIFILCFLLIFISSLALFLDYYLHKRVMIAGAIIKDLERECMRTYEDSKNEKESNNVKGVMAQIISTRGSSSIFKKTTGRYIATYGIGTLIVSIIIFINVLNIINVGVDYASSSPPPNEQIKQLTILSYQVIAFPILIFAFLFVLYNVIIDSKIYEEIFLDTNNYHKYQQQYNNVRQYMTQSHKFIYYNQPSIRKFLRIAFDEFQQIEKKTAELTLAEIIKNRVFTFIQTYFNVISSSRNEIMMKLQSFTIAYLSINENSNELINQKTTLWSEIIKYSKLNAKKVALANLIDKHLNFSTWDWIAVYFGWWAIGIFIVTLEILAIITAFPYIW